MIQLLRYAKKYRNQVILGPIFKFLEAVFELVLPLLMATLVDEGIRQGNRQVVLQSTGAMILMSIVGLICAVICQYMSSIASQGFGTELRNEMMKKINNLSHEELNHFGTDTLITRMTSDINQLQLALAMLIRLVIRAPFLSVGAVIMAFYVNWEIGLVFLCVLPIFCVILYWMIKKTVPLYRSVQGKLDHMNALVSQNLSGVRVIRAFARRKTETGNFAESADDLAKVYTRVNNISSLLTPATTLIMNLGIIGILYLGGIRVDTGSLTQGQVVALVNYMNQMLLALIVVSNLVVIFTRAAASAVRVNELFASQSSILNTDKPATGSFSEKALVKFKNVDFRYTADSGLALKQLNFTIEKKQIIGITGPTGSGKTTLTQLIPRFYDTSKGNIYFGGKNVRDWQLDELRSQIAIVPQTSVLFSGTIRENLLWGNPKATEEDCLQALKTAQSLDFIQSLPKGLETNIVEGGKNFSGGQRQRLTIARALMVPSKLLILDDSFSALDYQTDLNLRHALKENYSGAVLIISQRVRSLQQADNILVMNNGIITAQGTHQELLSSSREYQEIVASQEEEDEHEA